MALEILILSLRLKNRRRKDKLQNNLKEQKNKGFTFGRHSGFK